MTAGRRVLGLAAVAMLAVLLPACGRGAGGVDASLASDRAHAWLVSQLRSTGLVDSQQDFVDVCYTYDQAVAAVAFLAKRDPGNARKILDAMQQLQDREGAWHTAYACTSLRVHETQKQVGPAMWMAMAAATYAVLTGDDATYRGMAERAIAWSLQFQAPDGGLDAGLDYDGTRAAWCSTEHNLDAYAVLTFFGHTAKAAEVRAFLDGVAWNAAGQHWIACRGDTRDPLDVNTWGVSALGARGTHAYARALDYAFARHRTTQRSGAFLGAAVDGFDFDSDRNDVWLEGTAQMALALKVVGRDAEANAFIGETVKTQQRDGGVPYSLKGTESWYFRLPATKAVSSTGWLVLAIEGVNPFQPQHRVAKTIGVLPGARPGIDLNPNELITAGLVFFALLFAVAVVLVVVQNLGWRGLEEWRVPLALGGNTCAALAIWVPTHHDLEIAVPVALSAVGLAAASRLLPGLTGAGRLLLTAHTLFLLFGVTWIGWFIATIPVAPPTRGLLLAAYPLLLLTVPIALIQAFERWEVVCRTGWSRPHRPLPPAPRSSYPKVSFHVACYAEPPEVVMATLDAIARVRYPNFEVLVIDNNTPDPALWQPVEAHCRALGERFRFFHLHRWYGAKSGALNFALEHTAPEAELVALIDSDYQPIPAFLEAVVGYFDDPRLGFVQTPHDYRDWEHSRYLRMCYWEYKFGHLSFASLNERDAAIIVGTMCVIRRKALQEVGGWARWCVTEDSESAIRLHAAGYSSIYLTTALGHGLIPETFAGYSKQRFRWAYGPVQELKRHLRLFLPRPLGVPSALSPAQKLHHLNHGLEVVSSGLGLLLVVLGIAVVISMLPSRGVLDVPLVAGLVALVLPIGRLALRWLVHRVVLRCSLADMLGGLVAGTALGLTISTAALWGLCTRSIAWRRTSKFKALPSGVQALYSARAEILLGLGLVLFGGGVASSADGLVLLLSVAMVIRGIGYLAAPLVALLAERDVRVGRDTRSGSQARVGPGERAFRENTP